MIASTFVANSKYYSYPIELWKWGLREFETKVFETRKVLKPTDIAVIQNECLDELFKTHDTVFWLQADLIFDAEKTNRILDIVHNAPYRANFHLAFYMNKIYFHEGISGFGACIIKKEFFKNKDSKFCGDGAYTPKNHGWTKEIFGVSVGYLGKQNFINHTRQQQKIWNIEYNLPKLQKLIDPLKSIYPEVLKYFNLTKEYAEFANDFNSGIKIREKWT